MTINDQIIDEKLQYNINREAANKQKQVDALNTLKSNNQFTIEDVIPKNALNNHKAKK